MSTEKVTSKGQINLPKPICDYLELDASDKVEFIIDRDEKIILTSKTLGINNIYGMVTAYKSVSINDIKK